MAKEKTLAEEIMTEGNKGGTATLIDAVNQFLTVEEVEHIETKTRLPDPDGMVFYEETMVFLADDKPQRKLLGLKGKNVMTDTNFMGYGGRRKRVNEIPRDGLARKEGENVSLGTQAVQERRLRDKFFNEGLGVGV